MLKAPSQPRTFTTKPTRIELQTSPCIISRRPRAGGVAVVVLSVLVLDRWSCRLGAGGVALVVFRIQLVSKKSLSCFLPNCMATPNAPTLFPEAPDDDGSKA
jgi:hypothetical protein